MKADLKTEILGRISGQHQLGEGHHVAPAARARPIQSITMRALASTAPTVGLTWARATRTRLMSLSYRFPCPLTVRVKPARMSPPPATV